MRKLLVLVLLLAAVAAGCAVVPYDGYNVSGTVEFGAPVYVAPPPVVISPWFGCCYRGYYGHGYYHGGGGRGRR